MRKLAYSILISLFLTSISSPVLAEGRVPHNARPSRQAAIVSMNKLHGETGRSIVIFELAGGQYEFTNTQLGGSVSYSASGMIHVPVFLASHDTAILSVMALDGGAVSCKAYTVGADVLRYVPGGSRVSCVVKGSEL